MRVVLSIRESSRKCRFALVSSLLSALELPHWGSLVWLKLHSGSFSAGLILLRICLVWVHLESCLCSLPYSCLHLSVHPSFRLSICLSTGSQCDSCEVRLGNTKQKQTRMGFVPEELLERGTTGGCSQVYGPGVGCRQWGPERKE